MFVAQLVEDHLRMKNQLVVAICSVFCLNYNSSKFLNKI